MGRERNWVAHDVGKASFLTGYEDRAAGQGFEFVVGRGNAVRLMKGDVNHDAKIKEGSARNEFKRSVEPKSVGEAVDSVDELFHVMKDTGTDVAVGSELHGTEMDAYLTWGVGGRDSLHQLDDRRRVFRHCYGEDEQFRKGFC